LCGCFSRRRLTTRPAAERKYEMGQAEKECLQYICLPKPKLQHQLWKDHAAEDGLLHEGVEDLRNEFEQGEEKSTHCSSLAVNRREYQPRRFPSERQTVELDRVKGRIE